jgi:hypothetical protein
MTEERLQSECYIWFHNTFPHLRGLLCYNLNNSRNKIAASVNKAMGLQSGRSDMVFYYKGTAYHIELKVSPNGQSKEQKLWQKTVESQGFSYFIIKDSVDDFKNLINKLIA